MLKVAVVTPTICSEHLNQCLQSVQNQTYDNIIHYIFVDGREHVDMANAHIDKARDRKQISKITLDENIGKGWYGHRVYSACSFLVNADVICYLDEDNWFDPEHVEKLVAKIEKGYEWAYSLRKIYDKNGEFLCEDNCESLGKWPVYFNDKVFHIDTSSFAVVRDVATRIGHAWYGQWGADRQFFSNLSMHFPKFACTSSHTLCYRLDGNPNSVTKIFFEQGNAVTQGRYGTDYPWKSDVIPIQEIGPGIKIVA
jgi:glycosyltransferase involved in cell wall biosynthesis